MEHELIDLLNKQGKIIGTVDKAVAHKEGLWHRSVHLWIVNEQNEVLLQKRAKTKKFFPNVYDVSVAGHIGAGEHSLETAIREASEELGLTINKNKLQFLFTIKEEFVYGDVISKEFVDVYLLKENIALKNLTYQIEEVETAQYIKVDKFYNSLKNEQIFLHKEEYQLLKPYFYEKEYNNE